MDILSHSLSVARVRPRALTAELLGEGFVMPEHNLPAPKREEKISDYTDARIRQSLQFAVYRLNHRRLTPNSERIIEQYKKDSKAALLAEDTGDRNKHIGAIQSFESLLSIQPFLREEDPELVKFQQEILKLRRFMYLARYGDYFSVQVTKIRCLSGDNETEGYETLSAQYQWTKIAKSIREETAEKADWTVLPRNNTVANLRVTSAVRIACNGLGIKIEPIFWAIQQCAKRNTAVYDDIQSTLDKCQWSDLARKLKQDLDELPAVVSPKDEQDLKHLRSILEEIRDEWFDIAGPNPEDPSTWLHKIKAREWQGQQASLQANRKLKKARDSKPPAGKE
ncbi:hypothetical protein MMC11_006240 [Xylographa trunciseda]|nr:hypothetical protein [Xylographa trunciseda]